MHSLIISFQLGCDDVLAGLVEEVFFGAAGFFVFAEALAEVDGAAVDMVECDDMGRAQS